MLRSRIVLVTLSLTISVWGFAQDQSTGETASALPDPSVASVAAGDPNAMPVAATRDLQAISLLAQSINVAVGHAQGWGAIQDFVATGTITYFWAGEAVPGPATLRGRAPDQFRLDADLPDSAACVGCPGTRSYVINHGWGVLKGPDRTLARLPFHNTVNIGILSFPYPTIAALVADPSTFINYLGAASLNGRPVYRIRMQRRLAATTDPDGALSSLCTTDYFVDAQSSLILRTLDLTHPDETPLRSYAHEVEFDGYSSVNGIQFPRVVREKVDGQTIWEVQLSTISFNVGLTDADFVLQ